MRQCVHCPNKWTSHHVCNHQLKHTSVLYLKTTVCASRLHEHICLGGRSSSSRTSSNLFCEPKRSRESRACIGEDVTPIEDVEDLEEWPRDHKDNLGDPAEDIDDFGV